MAEYHLNANYLQRSAGRSSVQASAYRSRERFLDKSTGEVADYRHKGGDLVHSEMLWPDKAPISLERKLANGESNPLWSRNVEKLYGDAFGNSRTVELPITYPTGMQDRQTFWNFTEQRLTHPRAQTALDIDVMLPRELTDEQSTELVRSFAKDYFVSKGLVVDLNFHKPLANDGLPNPHAHLLISTRRMMPDGDLGKAARDIQDNPKLLDRIGWLKKEGRLDEALLLSKGTHLAEWREAWADYSNDFLERSGAADRIDHRTLSAQNIEREAIPNIGVAYHSGLDRVTGWLAQKVEAFKAIGFRNAMRKQAAKISRSKPQYMAEFMANMKEYAKDMFDELNPEKGHDKETEYER